MIVAVLLVLLVNSVLKRDYENHLAIAVVVGTVKVELLPPTQLPQEVAAQLAIIVLKAQGLLFHVLEDSIASFLVLMHQQVTAVQDMYAMVKLCLLLQWVG
jgi:hypothetical protein